jgi:hypothetical protein
LHGLVLRNFYPESSTSPISIDSSVATARKKACCAPGPRTVVNRGEPAGGLALPPRDRGNGRGRQSVNPASAPVLSADESAAVRDHLMGEIADLQSQESATSWAREALAAKNRLTSANAKQLEGAFEQRLTALPPADEPSISSDPPETPVAGRVGRERWS